MNKIVYCSILFLFLLSMSASAQKTSTCGTPAIKSDWLTAYQQRPVVTALKPIDSTLYIPMTLHSVGEDDGTEHFDILKMLDAFCTLNEDFKEANIQFYWTEDIRLIDNSAFNQHDSIYQGGLLMEQYDIENTVNNYIVKNPANNCGYNLPWASLTVSKGCAGKNNHTWAHEVGHHFTLPHTFFGWEGGISYKDTIPPNYSDPAPDYVTVDYTLFKKVLHGDTLIIDTIAVEKMDGSNCQEAADGFCDTQVDYLSIRWNCGNDDVSATLQTDPNGEKFRSDGTLIMSYSDDACANRFSPQQIAAMRAHLLEERTDLFRNPVSVEPLITSTPQLNSPIANESVSANAVELAWTPVENATRYVVQVGILPTFPGIPGNFETDQTSINLTDFTDLLVGRKYYWRVRPYSFFDTCTGYSETESFEVIEDITSVATIAGLNKMQVYPSVLSSGTPLQVLLETTQPINGNLSIVTLSGQVLSTLAITHSFGVATFEVSTNGLTSGVYLVSLETEEGKVFEKLIVQ